MLPCSSGERSSAVFVLEHDYRNVSSVQYIEFRSHIWSRCRNLCSGDSRRLWFHAHCILVFHRFFCTDGFQWCIFFPTALRLRIINYVYYSIEDLKNNPWSLKYNIFYFFKKSSLTKALYIPGLGVYKLESD